MQSKKSIVPGKTKIIYYLFFISQFISLNSYSENLIINDKFAELNILDK